MLKMIAKVIAGEQAKPGRIRIRSSFGETGSLVCFARVVGKIGSKVEELNT